MWRFLLAFGVLGCGHCETLEPAPEERVEAPEATVEEEAPPPVEADPLEALDLPPPIRITVEDEQAIDTVVTRVLGAGQTPGAVVVLGRSSGVVFRRAYGAMRVEPERVPMREDAIFDLASVTKLFTTVLVLKATESDALALGDDVGRWIPALRGITVEQLLTHTSGLPAVTPLASYAIEGREEALGRVFADAAERREPPGSYRYSDVGFLALGEVLAAVHGEPLEDLVDQRIADPLELADLAYGPRSDPRVVPTERAPRRAAPGEAAPIVCGESLDPRAWRLGGVAGHAGIFASADDLARFAQALLSGELLSPETQRAMTRPRTLGAARRGLGVDMDTPTGMSPTSFGHGGYTGVWLWMDPERDLFAVVATNRGHPDGDGRAGPLRSQIARLASEAVPRALPLPAHAPALGIDVLRSQDFAPLAGRRVALLTHAAAVARDGRRTVDLLRSASTLDLIRIFTPEHGLESEAEGHVGDGTHHGVPTVSLFGRQRDPPPGSLDDVDAVVIDLQDVGARFYTYFATMHRLLRAAADAELPVWVLDRPNPQGRRVAGPVSSLDAASFVNHHPLPILHGMTAAEMARFLVAELGLDVELHPVPMVGWDGRPWVPEGLRWVPPSPNLPTLDAVRLYPGVALVEGSNVSVGRGTDAPFEWLGAPWMDPDAVRAALPDASTRGLATSSATHTPTRSRHRGRRCPGVAFRVEDSGLVDPVALGLGILVALRRVHPSDLDLEATGGMVADSALLRRIAEGAELSELRGYEAPSLADYRPRRASIRLYADSHAD